jgi:hypothetical protein
MKCNENVFLYILRSNENVTHYLLKISNENVIHCLFFKSNDKVILYFLKVMTISPVYGRLQTALSFITVSFDTHTHTHKLLATEFTETIFYTSNKHCSKLSQETLLNSVSNDFGSFYGQTKSG